MAVAEACHEQKSYTHFQTQSYYDFGEGGLKGNESSCACTPKFSDRCRRIATPLSKVDSRHARCPRIAYRPIRPSDLESLKELHDDIFRYESEFFLNVVHGRDIVSWGAVDSSRPCNQSDELIGFVTARVVVASESELEDLLGYDTLRRERKFVYILTLGVVEPYRNLHIASSLVREVIKYASSISSCRAVYLHVIDYNTPAIHFYQKMSFKCLRKLHNFYYIERRHYDSFLYVYYVNGGRSPCSALCLHIMHFHYRLGRDLVAVVAAYMRSLFTSIISRIWKSEEKINPRWPQCKESNGLLMTPNRTTNLNNAGCQCV
ncbi:histone acetyltransferase MCC1 isoform X3 [Amborella trichopoda]|uniref:histone acetyltransferase MCC1 isoform X3 n=1 Tax=Amborella trichopoda TaxID=13333 RepID=UPI0009BDA6E1|nr:histone acetyltransferase MCC1 isoform X3 [Amborella trichopoda]|eukprot:XP_020528960.1 histone acetyltransferase MCC1 isoform X3 [Amborella trichopoda]